MARIRTIRMHKMLMFLSGKGFQTKFLTVVSLKVYCITIEKETHKNRPKDHFVSQMSITNYLPAANNSISGKLDFEV